MSQPIDVVVIGAGAAGLRAASRLVKANRSVVLLEARRRVGGRLLSPTFGDGRLDLGATWFWPNEPRVNALVKELNLEVFSQHLPGDTIVQSVEGVGRLTGNRLDVPSLRVAKGTQAIAEAMAALLPENVLHLDSEVLTIGDEKTHLAVRTDRTIHKATHVVLAVPPALAVSRMGLSDLLSDDVCELAKATPVWMGAMTKVVAHYAHPFWRDQGLAGAAFSQVGPIREIHDMSGPDGDPAALFGFAPPLANKRVGEDAVVAQLSELFGTEAANPVTLRIMDWRHERHTSPTEVETLTNYANFGNPLFQQPSLGGRLHWASTETSQVAPGHIEGALAAADRLVEQLLLVAN